MRLKVIMDPDAGYVPEYAHDGDAGLDLRSTENTLIPIGQSKLIGTGLRCEIPDGCVGLVFPRSGLGSKGITIRNAVGVVDSGYRGEVMCALWNTTESAFHVHRGDRICQMVVVPYMACELDVVDELSGSERGSDGHGSTGVR